VAQSVDVLPRRERCRFFFAAARRDASANFPSLFTPICASSFLSSLLFSFVSLFLRLCFSWNGSSRPSYCRKTNRREPNRPLLLSLRPAGCIRAARFVPSLSSAPPTPLFSPRPPSFILAASHADPPALGGTFGYVCEAPPRRTVPGFFGSGRRGGCFGRRWVAGEREGEGGGGPRPKVLSARRRNEAPQTHPPFLFRESEVNAVAESAGKRLL
jgi:hypothetical protein